ncbi:MAG: hypothetical protein ACAI35_20120 [Candidatus Methylacidiphilales bacterium]|nr:hypothetical protein [Candidatus Methylacidiphilales bacterium]
MGYVFAFGRGSWQADPPPEFALVWELCGYMNDRGCKSFYCILDIRTRISEERPLMGQQSNKIQKRRRRVNYIKRKQAAAKEAAIRK